uniref:ZP-C domain-containing protein n=1 Tax=Clytia hemisphaerica TaxID=252671 RepID=A0A7M6DM46_9CNID
CTQDIQGEKCIIEGQKETKEQKKSYFNLECQSNGLKAAFNLSHLERHGLPYIVRFKGEDHDCQPLNGTYGNLYGDDKLWIAANYSDCGIKAYEEGGKIAFEQTIVVEYDDESDFVFDFDILKAGTNAWTGLIYVGEKMDFDLSLNGASNSIKTSPQDCYATRLDGTGKYVLIKDRCSVGGETGVTITTTPQDTREFSWEMEAFRYFGDSDGIIITCRILICRNRPFDQLSEECRRCGQKAPLALRRKRNVDNEDDDVLTDKSVKSQPIFIAVRNTPDEMDGGSSGAKSSSDGLGTAETAAIIVIAGLVGLVLCIAIIKKIFFNNPTIKEVHIDSPRE